MARVNSLKIQYMLVYLFLFTAAEGAWFVCGVALGCMHYTGKNSKHSNTAYGTGDTLEAAMIALEAKLRDHWHDQHGLEGVVGPLKVDERLREAECSEYASEDDNAPKLRDITHPHAIVPAGLPMPIVSPLPAVAVDSSGSEDLFDEQRRRREAEDKLKELEEEENRKEEKRKEAKRMEANRKDAANIREEKLKRQEIETKIRKLEEKQKADAYEETRKEEKRKELETKIRELEEKQKADAAEKTRKEAKRKERETKIRKLEEKQKADAEEEKRQEAKRKEIDTNIAKLQAKEKADAEAEKRKGEQRKEENRKEEAKRKEINEELKRQEIASKNRKLREKQYADADEAAHRTGVPPPANIACSVRGRSRSRRSRSRRSRRGAVLKEKSDIAKRLDAGRRSRSRSRHRASTSRRSP
jgi:DNA repair exonuclease SbcCD ATPase subunit